MNTREECLKLCKSGRYETGEGTCAMICMQQLGDPRKTGCAYVEQVFGERVGKQVK